MFLHILNSTLIKTLHTELVYKKLNSIVKNDSVLTELEKLNILKIPTTLSEMSKYYLLSETDISFINQKRGSHNKIGFALLLCYVRYPVITLNDKANIPIEMLGFVAEQLKIKDFLEWPKYFTREATRWEHIAELKQLFNFKAFTIDLHNQYLNRLLPLAKQTDKGIIIAESFITMLREDLVIIPEVSVIERLCAEAVTIGNQEFYCDLINDLSDAHKLNLETLLKLKPSTKISFLHWLLQPAVIPKPKYMVLHINRLSYIKSLNLPSVLDKNVHHGRLIKLAKEGRNMPASEIQKFETNRRLATVTAVVLETKSSIIDEIIELNDKIFGSIFNKAKNSHINELQNNSKSINEKLNLYLKIGKALINAKQNNENPFQGIEAIISWDEFTQYINDTHQLARPKNFDSLYRINSYYSWIKRYTMEFLEILEFKASKNTLELLQALKVVK